MNQSQIALFNSKPHALHNDGTVQQLRKCLNKLFPDSALTANGSAKFYSRDPFDYSDWDGDSSTYLDIIPVTSFFTPDEKTIPVEELEAVVKTISDRMKSLGELIEDNEFDGKSELAELHRSMYIALDPFNKQLQTLINKYK